MAKYLVNVIMSTCVEVEVEAQNEEEARSLAFEEADPFTVDDWDYDIDSMEIRRRVIAKSLFLAARGRLSRAVFRIL